MKKFTLTMFVLLVFTMIFTGCDFGAICGDGYCDSTERFMDNCPQDCNIVVPVSCEETDGGLDYYQQGTTYWKGLASTDFCINSDAIMEYYCDEDNLGVSIETLCTNGCVEGACLPEYEPDECIDFDSGLNYFVSSHITVEEEVMSDYCDGDVVLDYFCRPDGGPASMSYYCGDAASTCMNGACVPHFYTNEVATAQMHWGDFLPYEFGTLNELNFGLLASTQFMNEETGEFFAIEDLRIDVPYAQVQYTIPDQYNYDGPRLSLELDDIYDVPYMHFGVEFEPTLNFFEVNRNEHIGFFGKEFVIKNIESGDELVFYETTKEFVAYMSVPLLFEYDGESYEVQVIGANSEEGEVHLKVNNEVESLGVDDEKTIAGLSIIAEEIVISELVEESASVRFAIIDHEWNFGDTHNQMNPLMIDSEDVDGIQIMITMWDVNTIHQIDFWIRPDQIENPITEDDYDYLELGDIFVDPLFGFELEFLAAIPDYYENRDYIGLNAYGEEVVFSFTNMLGDEYQLELYQVHLPTNSVVFPSYNQEEGFGVWQSNIPRDAIFILEDDVDGLPVSKVFEFNRLIGNSSIVLRNLASGASMTVESGDEILNTGVNAYVDGNSLYFSEPTKLRVYTDSSTVVQFSDASEPTILANITYMEIVLRTETSGLEDSFYSLVTYNQVIDEMQISQPYSWSGDSAVDVDGDVRTGISAHGTYYMHEWEDYSELDLYVPYEHVEYWFNVISPNVPVNEHSSGGGSSGGGSPAP